MSDPNRHAAGDPWKAEAGHRKLTKDSKRDLIGALVILAAIVLGMIAYSKTIQSHQSETTKDWYQERIVPPKSR